MYLFPIFPYLIPHYHPPFPVSPEGNGERGMGERGIKGKGRIRAGWLRPK